ncbi:MAG: Re/Si-specific NAD(P)(+) transhydrogenase subunit alpha [Desulfurivibrionaceae bacterium]
MKIAALKETLPGEKRVPLIPASVGELVKKGAEIVVESGIGENCYYSDEDYQKEGASVVTDREELLSSADMIPRLRKPPKEEISQMKKEAIHVSYLDPFNERELVDEFAACGIEAISLEMIPRSTAVQKMDALSSQANLGGYVAVIEAARELDQILPMLTTPAGTIKPARVFIIGAGVAGLQAIATARRLGARVEAFDTRPVVAEQVESLGAKFLKIDLGETGQTKDGYAKALTEEQLKKQQEGMAKSCAAADIVITTAQVFGKPAPRIISDDIIRRMRPGGVIVDMAVETGGNVEGSELDKVVEVHGVKIIGYSNLPGRVAVHASQMYSANLTNFISHFWDKENKTFKLSPEDDIFKGCLITHNGRIYSETYKSIVNK